MPSLRQKVTTYFRQLSFIAEPRDAPLRSPQRADDEEGNFIVKYLEGRMERAFVAGPEILHGDNPSGLPVLKISAYPTGTDTITAACTGPDEGLTGIKRSKLHLSASFADDIDFIDTNQDTDAYDVRKSIPTPNRTHSKFNRFGSTPGGASDQNANKTAGGMRSRKNSRTSISNLNATSTTTTTTPVSGASAKDTAKTATANNKATTIVVSMVSNRTSSPSSTKTPTNDNKVQAHDHHNRNLLNSKTGGDAMEANKSPATTATSMLVAATKEGNHNESTATSKLLEGTTERLLREAVSNQGPPQLEAAVAGVGDWKMESEWAYGISVSLYETNMLTKEPMGNPIADCYGMVVRGDAAAMAMADGVNWGDGARLAARSAVHGCLDYLDRAIFGVAQECMAQTTHDVFVSLLRALWEGHGCILEVGGALSTLTIAVVLPLQASEQDLANGDTGGDKYVVCACNVGDSLGYVYSKKSGVREFTQGSHDITTMRDMRDALGALGPADGNKPELSNLTMSMTVIEKGDIVFLTSDGVSDNFDPVVGKFAEAWTPDVKLMSSAKAHASSLAPKRQNKSASAIYARLHRGDGGNKSPLQTPVRPPRSKKPLQPTENVPAAPSRPKYMRSHTVIEPRRLSSAGNPAVRHPLSPTAIAKVPKSLSGLPLVTGPQRHALTLYRLEDLLSYGINGTFSPCVSARRLCHLLIDFVRMITSARRKTLEQRELFYKLATGPDGVRREVELNRMQHRAARKRIVDSSAFAALPGKLDHATVVAFTVGAQSEQRGGSSGSSGGGGGGVGPDAAAPTAAVAALHSKEFDETNF